MAEYFRYGRCCVGVGALCHGRRELSPACGHGESLSREANGANGANGADGADGASESSGLLWSLSDTYSGSGDGDGGSGVVGRSFIGVKRDLKMWHSIEKSWGNG